MFYLMVDLSASILSDAEKAKRRTVAEFCGLLTLSALSNNDRVGLIMFTDRVELVVPASKGRQQGMRILDALSGFEPKGSSTRLDVALDTFSHLARKRSVGFVISDFLAENYEHELAAAGFRHDVIAVNLFEAVELEVPRSGMVRIRDSETGKLDVVDFQAAQSGSSSSARARRIASGSRTQTRPPSPSAFPSCARRASVTFSRGTPPVCGAPTVGLPSCSMPTSGAMAATAAGSSTAALSLHSLALAAPSEAPAWRC